MYMRCVLQWKFYMYCTSWNTYMYKITKDSMQYPKKSSKLCLKLTSLCKLLFLFLVASLQNNFTTNSKTIKLFFSNLAIYLSISIYYITFIRPVLEYACPVWHCALTQSQQKRMERIQKRSLRIILSYQYLSYDQALSLTGLETLHERWQFLCLTFARKVFKSNRTEQWFLPSNSTRNLRNNRICLEPKYKTDRYRNSTIPFLTRLLNTYGLI